MGTRTGTSHQRTCRTLIVLGSGTSPLVLSPLLPACLPATAHNHHCAGGHTAEMLFLLEKLDFQLYTPRCYVVAATDNLGAQRALTAEQKRTAKSVQVHAWALACGSQAEERQLRVLLAECGCHSAADTPQQRGRPVIPDVHLDHPSGTVRSFLNRMEAKARPGEHLALSSCRDCALACILN